MLFDTDSSSSSYQIQNSLRFDGSNDFLARTPSAASNRKTWTWSGWVKCGSFGAIGNILAAGSIVNGVSEAYFSLHFISNLVVFNRVATGNDSLVATTSAVFRDPSAWYHIVVSIDTTQATNSNGVRVFVNGVQQTLSITNYTQNADTFINAATPHNIGRRISDAYAGTAWGYYNGYLSEINFIDGQALTAGDFGYTDAVTGQWRPKKYTGTYGTNGFYLPFNDGSSTTTLGTDRSGNGNNWTLTNMTRSAGVNDCWMTDTPTNNYATLNPLVASAANISNGGLASGTTAVRSTFDISLLDCYWEVTAGGSNVTAGTINDAGTTNTTTVTANKTFGFRLTTAGALDYINITDAGSWTSITTGLSGTRYAYGTTAAANWNFGQRSLAGTVPAGYRLLCTANLPVPSILNPNRHFDIKTYTGNASTQNITGMNFTPDMVWMKSRGRAVDHALFDSVRGVQKMLESNQAGVESTETTGLTAFNSDGWTMGALDQINGTTATNSFVGWAWKANGSAVTNTSGSITSQVSANTTAGFSIVTYTGTGANATVGHGLGVAPKMVIVKNRVVSASWGVWHVGIAATEYMTLNSTLAKATATTVWNSTAPSASVVSLGTDNLANPTQAMVMYCFAEVPGFSRFGSYTGNGSTDNAFVWLGFRPALVLIKCSSTTGNWVILDNKRAGYNVDNDPLFPNLSNAEGTTDLIDITSNGFKVRSANADVGAAQTYVFAAFAESPFNFANAR